MSLLMEALKKAEEAKRQGGDRAAETPGIPRTSDAADEFFGDRVPNNHAGGKATEAMRAGNAPERAAARNVFEAKLPPRKSPAIWIMVGAGALAALIIGGYFGWQILHMSSQGIAPTLPAALPSAAGKPLETVAADSPARTEPTPHVAEPVRTPVPRTAISTSGTARPPETSARTQPARDAPRPSETQPAPMAESPIRLSRTRPTIDPALERAYENLQAGRTADAQRDYEAVLRRDGKNTDALLGLATLAARQGETERAHAYYLRALESNPNDPTAKAGVISTRGQANDESTESRLKSALSSQPDSPPLLFALGNLYATQGRWSEAQQAYFRAYATEPDNPDFIFNLAVSLDQLHQNKLAAQYYRMALSAGEKRTASFDRAQADNRLQELQP